jgi:hypothetical protein
MHQKSSLEAANFVSNGRIEAKFGEDGESALFRPINASN